MDNYILDSDSAGLRETSDFAFLRSYHVSSMLLPGEVRLHNLEASSLFQPSKLEFAFSNAVQHNSGPTNVQEALWRCFMYIIRIFRRTATNDRFELQNTRIYKMKRQSTDWEKICAKHTSDKG